MSWDKGFDFRASSGYVTDPTNYIYVTDGDSYPTVRGGVTCGWIVAPSGARDRSTGVDPRLAGICFGNNVGTFQVDLPSAGTYQIALAMGDAGNDQQGMQLTIKDNATTVLSLGPSTTLSVNEWFDATDVLRTSSADWVANNVPVTKVFSSSTLILVLGAAISNSCIATLFLSQQASVQNPSRLALLGAG